MTNFNTILKELELTYAQTEIIKQAIEKYIIGEDEKVKSISPLINPWSIPSYARNKLRSLQREKLNQRTALYGQEKEA